MPIIYQKEPDEAAEAMRTGLKQMADNRAFSTPLLRQAVIKKAAEPVLDLVLPVYHLGLSDLAEGKDARASVNTRWRHMISQNNEIVAHGETIVDPNGIHHFAAINEGPLVKGISEAIETAEKQDAIKKGNYEARMLLVLRKTVLLRNLVCYSGTMRTISIDSCLQTDSRIMLG